MISSPVFPQPGLPVGFLQYLKNIGQGCARGRFPRHPGTGSPKDLATRGPQVGGPQPPKLDPSQKFGTQKNQKKSKFSKSKSVLPKMSARSGLVGKNPPGPIWAHLGPFFAWAGKIQKMSKFCLFSLVGPWALFTRFGPMGLVGVPLPLFFQIR